MSPRKSIILISNHIFHYRVAVYNYFDTYFNKLGFDLFVIAPSIQKNNPYPIKFKLQLQSFNIFKIHRIITNIRLYRPSSVIYFLHLKDIVYWPLVLFCKLIKIKVIYWNHGVNLQDPANKIKYVFHNFLHTVSNKIILYSKNEKIFISKNNLKKVSVAPNTINFNMIPIISESKEELRKAHNIKYDNIALFVGRITPEKRMDFLIDNFRSDGLKNILLIIVGSGLTNNMLNNISAVNHIIYFNERVDPVGINEIFKLSDIFVHPGAIGLSLNQAFYWGLPVITEDVLHGPEIIYLKDKENGFIVPYNDKKTFKAKIKMLFSDKKLKKQFSQSARNTIIKEANIAIMAHGFVTAFNEL